MLKKNKKQRIGLVLGGGGTRGLAHIGALEVIEELGIKIDAIAGCSIGSIIGALYASGKPIKEIKEHVLKYNIYDLLDLSLSKQGIKKTTKLQKFIESFIKIKTFQKLKIPLYVNATNISKSKEIIFSKGNIFQAIRASISVPGLFAPVKIKKMHYVDGAVINQNPFSILPKRINKYIIVNVSSFENPKNIEKFSATKIAELSIKTMQQELMKLKLKDLHKKDYIMIKPKVGMKPILEDKRQFITIINHGNVAAKKKISELKRKLNIKINKQR